MASSRSPGPSEPFPSRGNLGQDHRGIGLKRPFGSPWRQNGNTPFMELVLLCRPVKRLGNMKRPRCRAYFIYQSQWQLHENSGQPFTTPPRSLLHLAHSGWTFQSSANSVALSGSNVSYSERGIRWPTVASFGARNVFPHPSMCLPHVRRSLFKIRRSCGLLLGIGVFDWLLTLAASADVDPIEVRLLGFGGLSPTDMRDADSSVVPAS